MPSTNVLMGVGLLAIVALAVALILVLTGSSGAGNVSENDAARVRAAMTAAGCTFESQPSEDPGQHLADPDGRARYATFPASSGAHNPTTSIWGNYRLPVDPRQAVHNLEHGGLAIWYGPDISAADRGALDGFYEDDPNGIIVSPIRDPYPRVRYPDHEPLGGKIALTVWTADPKTGEGAVYVAVCSKFDQAAFEAFRDTFRAKGPERIPVSRMVPGGN